jgi:hypothetical protein
MMLLRLHVPDLDMVIVLETIIRVAHSVSVSHRHPDPSIYNLTLLLHPKTTASSIGSVYAIVLELLTSLHGGVSKGRIVVWCPVWVNLLIAMLGWRVDLLLRELSRVASTLAVMRERFVLFVLDLLKTSVVRVTCVGIAYLIRARETSGVVG